MVTWRISLTSARSRATVCARVPRNHRARGVLAKLHDHLRVLVHEGVDQLPRLGHALYGLAHLGRKEGGRLGLGLQAPPLAFLASRAATAASKRAAGRSSSRATFM